MASSQVYPVHCHTHLSDVAQRPRWLQNVERKRRGKFGFIFELLAEFFGVFFFVYCGVGATIALNIGNLTKNTGIGSLLTVGLAYGLGAMFAVAICSRLTGGHFNPSVTIAKAVWRKFPWRKVPGYIIAQIFGGYVACLFVYAQYNVMILVVEQALKISGEYDKVQFTSAGIAGAFALYAPQGSNIMNLSMNEYFADFFLGLVIWAVMDPTNPFIPPVAAPWLVGLAFVAVWNFAPVGLAANSARDVGGRLMAITIWGPSAGGGFYGVIAATTSIPAMLSASLTYELIFTDSSKVLSQGSLEILDAHKAQLEHIEFGRSGSGGGHLETSPMSSTTKTPISPPGQVV